MTCDKCPCLKLLYLLKQNIITMQGIFIHCSEKLSKSTYEELLFEWKSIINDVLSLDLIFCKLLLKVLSTIEYNVEIYYRNKKIYLLQKLEHLVHHFGSSCILSCNSWFSTGCFLDAVQFGFISSHVHHKAHASLEVGFWEWRTVISWPGGTTNWEKTKPENKSFQDQQDEQVGQVKCEDFRRRRRPCQKF